MKLLSTSEADLIVAAQALREGKLVAFPTETVYGLGANAFDERAVARVFEAKARPTFDPLIVHIARLEDILILAEEVPENAWTLARCLWPGPLTIILPKRREVPDIVTAGLSTVAVRFPSHPVARRIIELAQIPIAAPSANPFGYLSPTTAAHVIAMLGERIDYLVDGGPCDVGVESTVVDLTGERAALLRPGGMPLERIEELIGLVDIPGQVDIPGHGELSADECLNGAKAQGMLRSKRGLERAETKGLSYPLKSPGQGLSHYAPSTPLFLFDEGSLPEAV
ncbi:MAG: threonylcarbamoyl-AMP synthase, partial [Treponema sp.]|nr:threonylcarbamoyl-AMP synthase [Treponema sp.]